MAIMAIASAKMPFFSASSSSVQVNEVHTIDHNDQNVISLIDDSNKKVYHDSKRAQRERRRQRRKELLHSMTVDERRRFIREEEKKKVTSVEKMRQAIEPNGKGQKIAIDLSYQKIMNEKEIRSLSNQLKYSYGVVKSMEDPFGLLLFQCDQVLQKALSRFGGENWLVKWYEKPLTEVFEASELIYLSPDSPNVLTHIDSSKVYVLGGIVDKSRKKNATLNAANAANIQTARLPIQEHITERLDHILNVNTVIEVLVKFQECQDWSKTLKEVLPQRKQASLGRRALHRRQKKVKQLLQEQNKVQVEVDEKSMVTTISRVDLLEESLTKDCEISSSKQ